MLPIYQNLNHMPSRLWIVRHGESAGNLARDRALRTGATRIDLESRDVDVPLSPLGERQSTAVGHWLARFPSRPEIVLASPYRRAKDTATLLVGAGGTVAACSGVIADERLREKEFGILDELTKPGIENRYPEQAGHRKLLGKFYHRPPGGESWCDVILRLRSMLDTVSLHYAGRPVLVVTHQVVVLCLRYLLENLNEAEILEIDRTGDVANCAITEYEPCAGTDNSPLFKLVRYNHVAPLWAEGQKVTSAPDEKAAAP